MRRRLPIVGLIATLLLFGSLASRVAASTNDLAGVRSAHVVQVGRQLRWTVTFAHPLTRQEIAARTRGACLLIEQRDFPVVTRSVCLAVDARGLSLVQAPWADGAEGTAHPLAATVTRSGPDRITASFTPTALGIPYRSLRWQVRSTVSRPDCLATRGAHDPACVVLFPAALRPLAALHTPVLAGCVDRGSSTVSSGPTGSREIALTFDDGPWRDPPAMAFVDELKRLKAVGPLAAANYSIFRSKFLKR